MADILMKVLGGKSAMGHSDWTIWTLRCWRRFISEYSWNGRKEKDGKDKGERKIVIVVLPSFLPSFLVNFCRRFSFSTLNWLPIGHMWSCLLQRNECAWRSRTKFFPWIMFGWHRNVSSIMYIQRILSGEVERNLAPLAKHAPQAFSEKLKTLVELIGAFCRVLRSSIKVRYTSLGYTEHGLLVRALEYFAVYIEQYMGLALHPSTSNFIYILTCGRGRAGWNRHSARGITHSDHTLSKYVVTIHWRRVSPSLKQSTLGGGIGGGRI